MNLPGSPVIRVLSRRTLLAFALFGGAVLAGLALFGYLTFTQLRDAGNWIDQTISVRAQLRIVRIAVTDMEAGARSYLVTGDERDLEPYKLAADHIDANIARLMQLAHEPAQRQELERLRALVAEKRGELQKAILVRRTAGLNAALALVADDHGRRLMEDIRAICDGVERAEAQRLAARRSEQSATLRQTVLLGVLFAAMVAALLGTIYYLLRRDIAFHAEYEATLAAANAELESRIAERTRMVEDSRARLNGIVDGAPDAIISIDESERVVLANPAAGALFGYTSAQMLGMPVSNFIPERFRDGHTAHVQRFGSSPVVARRMAGLRVVHALRADGSEFPVDASISKVTIAGRKLYTVILRDISDEIRSKSELERSRKELRDLTAALEYVQEEERKRIARELHDDLGQQITVLKMDASLLRNKLGADQHDALRIAERIQSVLVRTVQSVRRLQSDLRPAMLDDLGLVAALEELVQQITQHSSLECRLSADESIEVPETLAMPLYRVAQESLNNVVKHAQATRVVVSLERDANCFILTVEDNGKGITNEDRGKRKSYGLIGMRERVYALGGEFLVSSEPQAGTRVEVRVPSTG